MDKTDAINIIQQYAEVLRTKFDFQKIILFGSCVNGSSHEDSDIDVAVVFLDYDNRFDMQLELMKLTIQIDSRIEPHPFRENEFNPSNPFVKNIVNYGMEVGC